MSVTSAAGAVDHFPRAADGLLQIRVASAAHGWLTLQLRGELDLLSAELLDGTLANYPDRRYVRLEVSELSFVDGAGLRSITAEHHRLQDRHGELVLTGVGAKLRRLLALSGLDDVLHTVEAVSSATAT